LGLLNKPHVWCGISLAATTVHPQHTPHKRVAQRNTSQKYLRISLHRSYARNYDIDPIGRWSLARRNTLRSSLHRSYAANHDIDLFGMRKFLALHPCNILTLDRHADDQEGLWSRGEAAQYTHEILQSVRDPSLLVSIETSLSIIFELV